MRGIGIFNVVYGGLGLAASLYLNNATGVGISLWTMSAGTILAMRLPARIARRLAAARRDRTAD